MRRGGWEGGCSEDDSRSVRSRVHRLWDRGEEGRVGGWEGGSSEDDSR